MKAGDVSRLILCLAKNDAKPIVEILQLTEGVGEKTKQIKERFSAIATNAACRIIEAHSRNAGANFYER